MTHRPLPRRTFLKGLGAALPLPFLEVMTPSVRAGRASDGAKPPVRYVWLYQSCGFYPEAWNPTGKGRDFQLSPTLEPMAPFQDRMTVFRNLRTYAYGNHIGKTTALLTGVQAERDRERGVFVSAQSIDQHLAEHLGQETLLPSLQLGIEHPGQGYCSGANSPVAYGATLSWNTPATMLMPEIVPRAAFDRLFGARVGPGAREAARWKGSILDAVADQARALQRRGSSLDRQKIEEYLQSVRSVEQRVQRASRPAADGIWQPESPPQPSDFDAPPPGVPQDRAEHVRMMLDLIVLALWTDTTRVATLIYANSLSEANFGFLGGITDSVHAGLSHHGGKPDKTEGYSRVNRWHAEQSAYLMHRLDQIDEGESTALDNSLVFFGSSLKDGHPHSNIDLPILCVGRAGGALQPAGQVFCGEESHIADLHLSTLGWYGIEAGDFNGLGAKPLNRPHCR